LICQQIYNQHLQNNTFPTLFVGQNFIKLTSVDSTNNYLKNLASKSEPLAEGTVIMAEDQFQGRGQQNSKWLAEPGKNLTFSIFFKPFFLSIENQFLLNIAVSIGIISALEMAMPQLTCIKWPNDIYLNDKKMGGILIENTIAGQVIKSSIIGVGLNVNQKLFNEELADKATSIANVLQKDVDKEKLLADICNHIENNYLKLKAGEYAYLKGIYLEKLYRFNSFWKYKFNGEIFEGKIVDVDTTGQLVLKVDDTLKQFNFKEIEFII
jgi:BirA family biotin operon repressor/biotin-[acetyl-CoA-carboxylase] ligase